MKPTDFSYYITDYLSKYLTFTAGLSTNTIISYWDTFSLLLEFLNKIRKLSPEKITIDHLDRKLIEEYLDLLERDRGLHDIYKKCTTCSHTRFFYVPAA